MSIRIATHPWIGLAFAAATITARTTLPAQQRGTIEFGGFASLTDYATVTGLETTWGGGGRIGAFLIPRLSLEFEAGTTRADRGAGLSRVSVGMLAARITGVPIELGPVSILVGVGAEHGDRQPNRNYGVQGLAGLKIALWDGGALRVDGIRSWRPDGDGTNDALHVGLALYRHPVGRTVTVTRVEQAPPPPMREDSVSAAETRRLRAIEVRYRALVDSLDREARTPKPMAPPPPMPAPGPGAMDLATMAQPIHFTRNRAELSDTARRILDEKIGVFVANPALKIVIVGHTSAPGTQGYNMALGMRRAVVARDYLIQRGIAAQRIEIASRGERELLVEGPGDAANAANRRGVFRLQIVELPPTRP